MDTLPPRLIGLYSPAPQSGKSTVANYLNKRHGFAVVKFAMPLKNMTAVLLEYMGYDNPSVVQQMIEGDLKEQPIMGFNKVTTRKLMQTLGTEWGRECIDGDFWVNIALNRIRKLLKEGVSVVIDDLRFPNEYQRLIEEGAQLWRIERPEAVSTSSHVSEGALNGKPFTVNLYNQHTLDDLYENVDSNLSN